MLHQDHCPIASGARPASCGCDVVRLLRQDGMPREYMIRSMERAAFRVEDMLNLLQRFADLMDGEQGTVEYCTGMEALRADVEDVLQQHGRGQE